MATGTANRKRTSAPVAGPGTLEFTAAAHEHTEPGGFDTGPFLITGATQPYGPFSIVTQGFIRHLALLLTTSTAGTGGTASADFPFNIFQDIFMGDVNGAQIFGPMDGYSAYLANVFGGYAFRNDIRSQADFSAGVTIPAFLLRLPFEIQHNNGLGAITNQNSAAAYQVRFTINPGTIPYTGTAPSPYPTIRIRGWLEAWTQPSAYDPSGRYAQAIEPPAHGTSQYWTKNTRTGLATGDNTIQILRVGNLIRCLIFTFRNSSGARDSTVPPDPLELRWDARQMLIDPQYLRRTYMSERNLLAAAPDAGVFAFQFNNDVLNKGGDGTTELYYATMQSTRLELRCVNIGGTPGTCDILTNDVAPVEVDQAARYSQSSATGFQPSGAVQVGTAG